MHLCENKFMEKRAIIIGATSGIGKQLAINLLPDAWVVGVAGRREAELMAFWNLIPTCLWERLTMFKN